MDLFSLTGRVAIVTGGNTGIGFGIARALTAAGARVAVAGRDAERNEKAANELGRDAVAIRVDIADPTSIKAMVNTVVERCGGIDILVNNAGINLRGPMAEYAASDWRRTFAVNLDGVFLAAQAAYPALKASGRGRVINISSIAVRFGSARLPAYSASKAAVVQLTQSMAVAWARDAIRANAILPGWIDTEMTQTARSQVEGLYERALARTPVGRWGRPEDLQGAAVFLASDAAEFITGASLVVDGGYSVEG